jgi:glyoxylase-like metal-dependent hydrolase (beta-lactamase superfamily II)
MTVERIVLENPVFDMEGANNAYLLDADEVALVDAGVATDHTRGALERGLAANGYDIADVDHVFLTHWHPDHAGLTSAIQSESGATVHVHEADAPLVAGEFGDLGGSRVDALERWGVPPDARAEIEARRSGDGPRGYGTGDPPTVEPFADGAGFDIGGAELGAVHTPGHTAGETCYVLDSEGDALDDEVFTGDALLPDYTANVGGADTRTEHALSVHVESLAAIAAAGDDRGWPGPGEPLADPTARARTVLAHHRDRAGRLLALLDEPTTVWAAARALFGDLAETHLMLGLGETHAHLEHLRREGLAERTDGRYVAATADASAALDAAFPEVRA